MRSSVAPARILTARNQTEYRSKGNGSERLEAILCILTACDYSKEEKIKIFRLSFFDYPHADYMPFSGVPERYGIEIHGMDNAA